MLVDDDPFVREVAAAALAAIPGVTVAVCASGAEALAAFTAFSPSLVLLDLMMPAMDGRAVWTAMAALGEPRPKLILLTGRDDGAARDEAAALGAQGLIAKPFDPGALAATVLAIADRAAIRAVRLEGLARDFAADLPAAMEEIMAAWQDLAACWNSRAAQRLLDRAHRIAGVAPIFGFAAVGAAADRLEEIMRAGAAGDGWRGAEERSAEAALRELRAAVDQVT